MFRRENPFQKPDERRKSLFVAALSLAFILLLSSVIVAFPVAAAAAGDGEDKKFEIQEATIEDIQNAIKSGEITATELVHMYLERIKAYNGVCVNEPEGILGPVSTIPNADQ